MMKKLLGKMLFDFAGLFHLTFNLVKFDPENVVFSLGVHFLEGSRDNFEGKDRFTIHRPI